LEGRESTLLSRVLGVANRGLYTIL